MNICDNANQEKFPFCLPKLPYDKKEFEPHLSSETFDFHHGKHHNGYVQKLNNLIQDDLDMQDLTLEQIIKLTYTTRDKSPIFNNAAQIWNHSFFWHSINPKGGGEPNSSILFSINQDFGSYQKFVEYFTQAALSQFGSGWVWLVLNQNNKLEILKTDNANNPINLNMLPLIVCDVWEHAYYIDLRNDRAKYVSIFLNYMINWHFAAENIKRRVT